MISLSKYKRAVGQVNTKGWAKGSEITTARNTSMGHNMRQSAAKQMNPSQGTTGPRGSWEGYDGGSSTWIKMNGSGYDAKPNARTAAYGRSSSTFHNSSVNAMNMTSPSRSGMMDYRQIQSSHSAASSLRKRL